MNAELDSEVNGSYHKDETKHWFYPWLIWGLGAAFFLSEYLGRVAPSVIQSELMQTFDINATKFGMLGTIFLIPYIVMQMPVGMLVDRYGPHKLLTATCAVCAFGCYVFASSTNIYVAQIGRFLMGFSAAFAFVGAVKLATLWFCPTRLGLLAGLTQALGMLGAALGEGLVAVLVNHVGWRQSMIIIGCILLTLALLIGFIVRDRPRNDFNDMQPSEELGRHISYWQALLKVFSNPQSWFNGLFIGLLYAPTGVFAELWGVSYVMQNNGLPRTIAARAVSMIFIGWAVGGPLAGMLSDKIRRRVPVMFGSAILCLIFLSAILYIQDMPVSILFLLMFLYGLTNTGVGVSYALSGEINSRQVAGTSIAFSNMASILIAAALQPIVGSILDANWDGTMLEGAKIYSTEAYHIAMTSLPICLLLSVFACLLVKETYCKMASK